MRTAAGGGKGFLPLVTFVGEMEERSLATVNWVWVDDPQKMRKAGESIGKASLVAVDTEYDSFRYFREKLCLIQVKAGKKTYVFDPLEGPEPTVLGACFSNPAVLKIMHAGDNDVRILKRDYGFSFRNIFDTHRAASLLGCRHLALSTLIEQYLGIAFTKEKKMQRSRWDLRPLSQEQLQYAVADTEHLADLYRVLDRELRERGLEAEAARAFEEVAAAQWREKELPKRGHERINGYMGLNPEERKRLQRLFRWRFRKAKERNRALFMILSDRELIALSRSGVCSTEELLASGILSAERAVAFSDLASALREDDGRRSLRIGSEGREVH